jgi:hypothetical protein
MKFVCTECDEPMKFDQNGGLDEDGSMSATFRCPSSASGSSCPFSALIQDTFNTAQSDLRWSVEAEQRLERAPSFVRAMVRRGIEEFAREQGYAEITPQVMDEARTRMGM